MNAPAEAAVIKQHLIDPEICIRCNTCEATCPVQAFRLGSRVYATQFHPELDNDGLVTRIEVYRHYGYFEPAGASALIDSARAARVTDPPRLLARFDWSITSSADLMRPSA